MKAISKLFGRSPFALVVEHGKKVEECVNRLTALFEELFGDRDEKRVEQLAREVTELETRADEIRNRIHEALSGKIMMAVSRGELFDIVEQQDSMADQSEEIAACLTFRPLRLPKEVSAEVFRFVGAVFQNCAITSGVVSKLDLLIESAFAERDARTVLKLIDELRARDDQTRSSYLAAMRVIYRADDLFSPAELILWVKIVEALFQLSKFADYTANGLRIVIENQKH